MAEISCNQTSPLKQRISRIVSGGALHVSSKKLIPVHIGSKPHRPGDGNTGKNAHGFVDAGVCLPHEKLLQARDPPEGQSASRGSMCTSSGTVHPRRGTSLCSLPRRRLCAREGKALRHPRASSDTMQSLSRSSSSLLGAACIARRSCSIAPLEVTPVSVKFLTPGVPRSAENRLWPVSHQLPSPKSSDVKHRT